MKFRRYFVPALIWCAILLFLVFQLDRILLDPTGGMTPRPAAWTVNDGPVLITEFLANNQTDFVDEDGDPSDWIELYNRSNFAVNLVGWSLTDDPTRADKWQFGELILEPGQHLLVFASGKDRFLPDGLDAGQGPTGIPIVHTNFALESNPAYLALHPPTSRRYLDGSIYEYPYQPPNVSFGLVLDDNGRVGESHVHFDVATPGGANHVASAWTQVYATVRADVPAGFYADPFEVELTAMDLNGTPLAGAEIRYTTDGSLPSIESGQLYTGAIHVATTTPLRAAVVEPGRRSGEVLTHTYIFVDHVLQQAGDPPGFPETWGTHESALGGYEFGTPREAIYGMDPRITQHVAYGPMTRAGLMAIPSLSLVMPVESLDIYASSLDRGRENERAVSIEFLYPPTTAELVDDARAEPDRELSDGADLPEGGSGIWAQNNLAGMPVAVQVQSAPMQENVQIDGGIRMHGGAGRWSFMPKQSFRLYFRSDYGSTRLQHQVFPDSPVTEFNRLVLRAGTDRSFAGHPPTPENPHVDHRLATYTRDEWARRTQIAMSGYGSHGTFVHLYINGLYWGLYNLVERIDTDFAADNLGGRAEEWFSVTQGGMRDGMPDRFLVMLDLAEQGGLADPERYATMLEFIDPIQFSDYMILQWYSGNRDWPENNWSVVVQYPAGRNLFLVWDSEDTWHAGAEIRLGSDGWEGAPFPNIVKLIFEALWENPDFRLLFADRLHANLAHDGPLTDANALARWESINTPLEDAIAAESARWGGVRYPDPITPDDWQHARLLVTQQMEGNADRLLDMAREAGYYPPVDAPSVNRPAGAFGEPWELTLAAPGGEIYYTLDGTDPRDAVTGAPGAQAHQYAGAIPVDDAIMLVARVRHTMEGTPAWSAATRANYWPLGATGDVRITEFMYNPVGGGDFEFVEITNLGTLPVDLSGASFEGIRFTFGEYQAIEPGERKVLVRDFRAFRSRYPEAPIHGVFQGRLSNQGEFLGLRTRDGALLDGFVYGVDEQWPISAGGAGDSLVRHRLDSDPNLPQSWRASALVHGSPGAEDGTPVAGAPITDSSGP